MAFATDALFGYSAYGWNWLYMDFVDITSVSRGKNKQVQNSGYLFYNYRNSVFIEVVCFYEIE
jgi:hypothetical protein